MSWSPQQEQAVASVKTSHDIARQAMQKHGISTHELLQEMKEQRLCIGHEQRIIDQFVDGGALTVGLAVALFGVIGRQTSMREIIH
jgi:hypothetical protein